MRDCNQSPLPAAGPAASASTMQSTPTGFPLLAHQLTHVHLQTNAIKFNGQMSPICGLPAVYCSSTSLLNGNRTSPVTPISSAASKSPSIRGAQDDDSEDESEIIEESPCGRWWKRREEVSQLVFCFFSKTFSIHENNFILDLTKFNLNFVEEASLCHNSLSFICLLSLFETLLIVCESNRLAVFSFL